MTNQLRKTSTKRDIVRQSETLRPQQRQAIAYLMTSKSVMEAAKQVGVDRRTIYRWMREEDFRRELQIAKDAYVTELSQALTVLAETAVATLKTAMIDPEVPAGVKVRAASEVLKHRRLFHELDILTHRLAAVEDAEWTTQSMVRWLKKLGLDTSVLDENGSLIAEASPEDTEVTIARIFAGLISAGLLPEPDEASVDSDTLSD